MGVTHDTISVTRELAAPIERVFHLWSDTKALQQWYLPSGDGWESEVLEHSFEVGGRNHLSFGRVGEPPFREDCRYEDIAQNERIIFSATVSTGDVRLASGSGQIAPRFERLATSLLG
jgi:uncharacterized protein YndB with AHSA1/START domain